MTVIGLTGGMASGKSTVAKYIRQAGVPVFDADLEAKKVVEPGTEGLRLIVETFGKEYLQDGALDRGKLAGMVFSNPEDLARLNSIIHGQVWDNAQRFIGDREKQGDALVVLDVPLLVQTGWHKKVDRVWVVTIPYQEQIKRAMARNGMSEEMAKKRLAAQISNEELYSYGDVIIDNSGTLEETYARVQEELGKIRGELEKQK